MYQLEKYRNVSSRHTCPQCGDKHSLAYYVDEDGAMLDERVGRCNHESGCGYHYTPKHYFQDHPERNMERISSLVPTSPEKPKEPDYIPFEWLWATFKSGVGRNDLMYFIWNLFDYDKTDWNETITNRLSNEYGIGTYGNDVVFWQIDINGNIRTGKIMKYKRNGHRVKGDNGDRIDWVHAKMKKKGILPDTFSLVQCLFGEHLLAKYSSKKVAVVESEKTALLGSACFDNFVWVATGGKNTGFIEKCKVLKGRDVILFPDFDGFTEWQEKSALMTFCRSVRVSDMIIKLNQTELAEISEYSQTDKGKIDIGDWIVSERLKSKIAKAEHKPRTNQEILDYMTSNNPAIAQLVNGMGLKIQTQMT